MSTAKRQVDNLNKQQLLAEYEKIKNHKSFLPRKQRDLIVSKVNKHYKEDVMSGNINVLKLGILKESAKNPGKKMMAIISDPVYTEIAFMGFQGHKEIGTDGNDLFLNGTLLRKFTDARKFMNIPENVTETMFFVTERPESEYLHECKVCHQPFDTAEELFDHYDENHNRISE